MVLKLGRDPTVEELADAMDMTVEKIKQIRKASLVPISLNQNLNDDDKRTVEETLIDDYTEHPDDATGKVLLKEDLENVLNTLNPRERDVLRLRYGLGRRSREDARGDWKRLQRHARAHPTDRGQGAA